jgi:hypothetical protein
MENSEQVPISVYKELLCSMIQDMDNERFIKQIYSIVLRETQRS